MLSKLVCVALAVVLCVPALCLAQDSGSSGQGGAMQRDWSGQSGVQSDQSSAMSARGAFVQSHIAAAMILCNQSEVAINQMAIDKAKSDEVKQFAQNLVKQHDSSVAQLKNMLPQAIVTRLRLQDISQLALAASRRTAQSGQGTPYTVMRPSGDVADTGVSQSPTPLLDIDVRTTQNMVSLIAAELGNKEGVEFDKAFIGQQIASHLYILARLRAVEPFVSGDLKQIVQDSEKLTVQHLNQAKQIMDNLQRS